MTACVVKLSSSSSEDSKGFTFLRVAYISVARFAQTVHDSFNMPMQATGLICVRCETGG